SARATPASSRTSVIRGASDSACLRRSSEERDARRVPSSPTRETATAAEVSRARTATRPGYYGGGTAPRRRSAPQHPEVDTGPARPDGAHGRGPRPGLGIAVGVLLGARGAPRALQVDLQAVVGERLGEAAPPLHDRHGVLERGVEVQRVELAQAAETVGVDVHEPRTARAVL